jgi:hypothetical protein
MKKRILLFLIFIPPFAAICQDGHLHGWHLKDHQKDGYYGISLDEAYHFLSTKKIKSTFIIN